MNNLIDPKHGPTKDTVFSLLRILVTIGLLTAVAYWIGLSNIWNSLWSFNWKYLPAVLFWMLLMLFASAVNIFVTVYPIRFISLGSVCKDYLLAWSAGFFGLGKVGELSIVYWLSKEGISLGESTAVAVLDKAITFVTLLLLSGIGLVYFFGWSQGLELLALGVIGLLGFAIIFFTSFGRRIIRSMIQSYASRFEGFGATIDRFFSNYKKFLVVNLMLTLVRWLAQAMFTLVLLESFGVSLPLVPILLANSVATLVSLLPVSINGLGVKEASFTAIAQSQNWPLASVASMIAVSLALHYALLGLILAVFARELHTTKRGVVS